MGWRSERQKAANRQNAVIIFVRTPKYSTWGVDFSVSGENVCEADKRGAACRAVAKIFDF